MASESNQVTQVKLKGSNYSYWSYLLKVYITGKELRGYLDGSVVAPRESDTNYAKLQQEWETNNARILSWINNSVEPSIGMHFSKFTSAKEVWDYLEGLYMQSNFAKRYELENVIRGERQDDKSVQEFYNVMNGIWDQLDLMDPLELRKLAIYQKVREEQKLVQFLMALRTEFKPLRGSMLHRSPLPSVDKVLSELVAEETRLKSSLLHSMQTQVVPVATQRPQFLPLVPSRATPPSGNFRVALDECSFCHEKGHWKRDYPKLRKKGILPSPNHFSQNSRNAQRTMNTGAFMTSGIALDSSHTSGVTHEDVQSMVTQQIQQLLDEVMSSPLPFPSDTPSLPESNADPDDALPSPSQVAPRILLLIYVDDIIITGDDSYGISKLKDHLYDKFEMKDLGLLRYFLGIEVAYSPKGYLLSQTKYANDILSRAKLTEVKVVDTPLELNVKLCLTDSTPLDDATLYRQIVGSLVYLTITRPDVAYAVHVVSQFVSAPRSVHWSAVVHILRYIHGTLSRGLLISSSPDLTLSAYSDADWAGDVSDRRSTTGFCIFLGDFLISWKCKKQSVVSRSSSEVEYRAMANTTAEIVWVRWLLRDMGATQSSPTPMFSDNKTPKAPFDPVMFPLADVGGASSYNRKAGSVLKIG
ncbi:hypothetical protein RJ639_010668 [Escallonia herrerae]|uniref:Reverse transcriptase Ty1/copia-type domain-containing protein n=1 Tax=Escallonia herrerae TaxID=1293975 RepID=A0AA88VNL1_9ASTE|nr:hypothetical protein RJ639_010668 [Escallonia herrerae]